MSEKPELSTVIKSFAASAKDSAREIALKMLASASSARGANCLSREQSIALCREHGYSYQHGEPTKFELGGKIKSLEVMRCGVVRLNKKECLYTDFGNRAAAIDFTKPKLEVDHAIAVWSHRWLGFHHFLSELLPKICLLRKELGTDLGGAKICYPKIHKRYEKELIALLDLPDDQIIDTWEVGGVIAKKLTVVPMAGWFQGNPNAELLREQLLPSSGKKGPERLYLSRAGRRRCLNDAAIVEHCKNLGFVEIDESSRTIADQIELYRDAKILFGPHGSAFTNMVWAAPGAHVIEMIPTTFDVTYHAGLSKSLGHHYTKISCHNGPTATTGVTIDFNADVDAVKNTLNQVIQSLSSH
jgi:capsular polysaccharide biosynthesis protein